MKKVISTILTVALLTISAVSLTSCDEKHTCFFCLEERHCIKKTFWGDEVYICDKCVYELTEAQ